MPGWIDRIRQEAKTVASTPFLFGAAALAAALVILAAVHWSYRTVLSSKDMQIAFLDRRVAEYRDSLNGAPPEVARRRIEALETEVNTLRLRLQPRRITPAQQQAIIDRSRLPAGVQPREVTVVHEQDCSDCTAFAADLVAALRADGSWIVTTEAVTEPVERPRTGLGIRVPDPLRPPPEAVVLQQALRSAGLAFTIIAGGTDQTIELLITERDPH